MNNEELIILVTKLCKKYTKDPHVLGDLIGDSLEKCYKVINNPKNYILNKQFFIFIINNAISDYFRKVNVKKKIEVPLENSAYLVKDDFSFDSFDNVNSIIEYSESKSGMEKQILDLLIAGYKSKDIMKELKLSKSKLKNELNKYRKDWREDLAYLNG